MHEIYCMITLKMKIYFVNDMKCSEIELQNLPWDKVTMMFQYKWLVEFSNTFWGEWNKMFICAAFEWCKNSRLMLSLQISAIWYHSSAFALGDMCHNNYSCLLTSVPWAVVRKHPLSLSHLIFNAITTVGSRHTFHHQPFYIL